MKFEVLEIDLSTLKRQLETFDVSDHFTPEQFKEVLDDTYGTIDVCGYTYDAGDLFELTDNIAFREEYNNYLDSLDLEEFAEYRAIQMQIEEIQEIVDSWDNIRIDDWAGNILFEGNYKDKEVDQILEANKCPPKTCVLDFEGECENCDSTGYSGDIEVCWQDEDREDNVYEFINY